MVLVNGQYPGPSIYAREGDRLVINVTNNAMMGGAGLTIHWHGVAQKGSPWADGTAFITQCPITFGHSYIYDFHLTSTHGTLFWHAHVDWLRASIYGALVILPTAYPFLDQPDSESTLLLGEWWSEDLDDIVAQLNATGGPAPPADANTINGLPGPLYKSCGAPDEHTEGIYTLQVSPGKRYLLRLINAAMHASFFFAIANHTLTIVEADAAYTKAVTVETVFLAPGQTMSVLLKADGTPAWYRIVAAPSSSDSRYMQPIPASGLMFYSGVSGQNAAPSMPDLTPQDNPRLQLALDSLLRSLSTSTAQVPIEIDRYIFLAMSLGVLNASCANAPTGECEGPNMERTTASLNNISFVAPNVSILETVYAGHAIATDFPDYPANPFNYTRERDPSIDYDFFQPLEANKLSIIDAGDEVEIVLQDTGFPNFESHPMHLHGYSFYVVGSGLGIFDPISDPRSFNLDDPPSRNTVAVPAGGWSVIRFTADNPGVWFFHCHVESHQYWGMDMVLWVKDGRDPQKTIPPPPQDLPQC